MMRRRRRSLQAHYADGRTVVQCACARPRRWRGEADAFGAGWRRRWVPNRIGDLVQVWTCPSCSPATSTSADPAPSPAAPAPAYAIPARLLAEAERVPARAMELLERLHDFDPPRADAFLRQLIEAFEPDTKAGRRWRAYARGRRIEPRQEAA